MKFFALILIIAPLLSAPFGAVAADYRMHTAASHGKIKMMEKFINAGADIHAVDFAGNTPLHRAAIRGKLKAVCLLLRNRAKTDIKNKKGQTPAVVADVYRQHTAAKIIRRGWCAR